jgi:O-antigen chain-terminating methyltransferase
MEADVRPQSFSKSSSKHIQPPRGAVESAGQDIENHQQLLEITLAVAAKLRQLLGRPLRVIDLGCAQGLFSLELARAGDEVLGADAEPDHILSCQTQAKALGVNATFITADITNWQNCDKSFDLALAFNLAQLPNLAQRQRTVQALSQRTAVALIASSWQITAANTPNTWPDNPFQLLQPFAYLEKLTEYPPITTHFKQPVFFCSDSYWYAKGAIQRFDYWTELSRQRFEEETPTHTNFHMHKQTRRYYFTDTQILKHYRLTREKIKSNRNEVQAEINFIENNISKINTLPNLLTYNVSEEDAWILREKIPGTRLSCIIQDGGDYDSGKVLASLLQQLALFEQHGFYQNDLRPWNFILSENNTVFIIDYGTVSPTPRDSLSRRKSIYMSFLMLAHEVIYKEVLIEIDRQFSPVYISPRYFPENYTIWLSHLLSIDFSQWSFALFLELLDRKELPHKYFNVAANNMQLWLNEVDQQSVNPKFKIQHFQKYFIKKLRLEVTKASWKHRLNTFISRFLPSSARFNQKASPEIE